MGYIFLVKENKWVLDTPEKEKTMEKTLCFKVEYTIQADEKIFDKLKDENGNYIREKLLDEKNFKKSAFFAKNLVGKVKDFEME